MEQNTIYLTCHDKLSEVREFLNRFFNEKHGWSNHDGWVSFVMPATGFVLNLMDGSGQGMKKTQNVAIEISFNSLNELQEFAKKHGVQVQSFDTYKTDTPYTYYYCEIKSPDNICFIEGNFSSQIVEHGDKKASDKKVGIFIDASNMYFSERRAGWKIDYEKLKTFVNKEFDLAFMKYYVAIPNKIKDEQAYLHKKKYLNKIASTVEIISKPLKYIKENITIDGKKIKRIVKKGDVDIDLAVDVLSDSENLDVIIILSGDSDYVALRDKLLSKGKKVLFIAHKNNLAHEIRQGKYVTLNTIRQFIELKSLSAKENGDKKQTPASNGEGILVNLLYTNN